MSASAAHFLIGVGGNLGTLADRQTRFVAAEGMLRARLPVAGARWSLSYLSAPVGPMREQPEFLNAVLELSLAEPQRPVSVLAKLLDIEARLLRQRPSGVVKGPRTIDLDLLFADDLQMSTVGPPPLQLPHPRIAERAFVLRPLADLMGRDWPMPGLGCTIAECLQTPAVATQDCRPLGQACAQDVS